MCVYLLSSRVRAAIPSSRKQISGYCRPASLRVSSFILLLSSSSPDMMENTWRTPGEHLESVLG